MSRLPTTVTTRVEDDLAKAIDEVAEEEKMDRSTVIRRFLSKAVRDWMIERSLAQYEDGEMTLWQAAGKCGLSLWQMIEEARKREVHVPYAMEELREDLKAM
jgi:antitoxin component of RelBE/YafQ-DinJ toxin-antitoxin module